MRACRTPSNKTASRGGGRLRGGSLRATACRLLAATLFASSVGTARSADEVASPYDDPPPIRATHGIASCPTPPVVTMTLDAARREAHQRAERGTSCWLAGKCPPGGDYRDDRLVNEHVAAAVAADPTFRDTSVWVETLRKFVTVKGCLARQDQGPRLERLIRAIPGVKLVWQEARIDSTGPRPDR